MLLGTLQFVLILISPWSTLTSIGTKLGDFKNVHNVRIYGYISLPPPAKFLNTPLHYNSNIFLRELDVYLGNKLINKEICQKVTAIDFLTVA